jgi:hypothetical protein
MKQLILILTLATSLLAASRPAEIVVAGVFGTVAVSGYVVAAGSKELKPKVYINVIATVFALWTIYHIKCAAIGEVNR